MQRQAANGTRPTTHDPAEDAKFHRDVIYLAFALLRRGTAALRNAAAKAANIASKGAGDGRSCR